MAVRIFQKQAVIYRRYFFIPLRFWSSQWWI